MSRLTMDVQIDALGRRVQVRELDVSEIRAHLRKSGEALNGADADFDVTGAVLFQEAAFSDIHAMTDITPDEISCLMPSEIKVLIAACQEVNADFFGLRARLLRDAIA